MPEVSRGVSVAISRQQGSGGSFIGRAVAERLGLRYFDREMLRTAAEYLGAQDQNATGIEQEGQWFERLGSFLSLGCVDVGYVPPSPTALYDGELFQRENRLIREIVDEHVAVIVGRGAAQTLRGSGRVLTVFVHAPEASRIERVQQLYQITDKTKARQMVRRSDEDRRKFVRALVDVDWGDARGYDLSVDSDAVGFEAAVDLIVRAAAARGAQVPAFT